MYKLILHIRFCSIFLFQGYIPLGSPGSGKEVEVLKHPVLKMVAEKLGKTPAQVALRWGLQMGHSVLPKSTNDARIRENFDVFDWSIPEDLFSKFSEIGQVSNILQLSSFQCLSLSFTIHTLHVCYFS